MSLGFLVIDIEQRRHRLAVMDAADRLTQQRCNADNFDFSAERIGHGDRIGGDHLFDFRSGEQPLLTGFVEQTVRDGAVDLCGTVGLEDLCGGTESPPSSQTLP